MYSTAALPLRVLTASERTHYALLWLALLLGGVLRLYAFGSVPEGINPDEATAGVEALSILKTGGDLWSNRFPVYLPAWGSGMNALYSYLSLPIVAAFGLNGVTTRLLSAFLGILTIPVTYFAGRVHFGRDAALVGALLVAVLPGPVMSARWGLESNMLPFWFTLGVLTLGKALEDGARPICKITALLPWAIGNYAYAVAVVPASISALLILFFHRRKILAEIGPWLLGAGLAGLVSAPLILFLLVNFAGVDLHGLIGHLPFSVPRLPISRLHQIRMPIVWTIVRNITFLFQGYLDGGVWNQIKGFPPLTGAAPFFTILAGAALVHEAYRSGRPSMILLVLFPLLPSLCLYPLNATRLNWFFIPSVMAIAFTAVKIYRAIGSRDVKAVLLVGSVVFLLGNTLTFARTYFRHYTEEALAEDLNLGNGFRVGLADALHGAVALAPKDETILAEAGTHRPYAWLLFYGLGDPRRFQATRTMTVTPEGIYHVRSFDRFIFDRDAVAPFTAFTFVTRSDNPPCADPGMTTYAGLWAVGRCRPGQPIAAQIQR